MDTQPEALRLADELEGEDSDFSCLEAADELRRLHAAREECERQYQAKCDEIGALHEVNQELLEALKDVCLQFLQRGVTTDPEHPDHVAIKTAEAIIAKATGEQA